MKKYAIIGMAVFFAASSAMATVAINWVWDENRAQGVVQNDGSTALPANSIVQLIWSADATLGALNVNDPLAPTGGDVLLDTGSSTAGGFWDFGVNNFANAGAYVGGYVFQRVFDVTVGNTPGNGDYYGDGSYTGGPLADADGSPTPPPDNSFLWSSSGSPFTVGTQIIVPEPGTLAFALIGLGAIMLRRRMRK